MHTVQPTDSMFGVQKQSMFQAGNASFMQPLRSTFGGSMMDSSTGTGSVMGSMMGSMMGSIVEDVQGVGGTTSRPETRAESRLGK